MELCKEYKNICIKENSENITSNFDVDFQENIPQYLDDIEKVIKCNANSVIVNYEIVESKITLHGKCIISVTYLNKDGCVFSNIFEEEFTKALESSNTKNIAFINCDVCTKYNNFRLVNQRRIDIHSSLKVNINIYSDCNQNCLDKCENAFVRRRELSSLICKSSSVCSCEFEEKVNVAGNSKFKNIANSYAVCSIAETKIIKDKMLVKINAQISVVYSEDNSGFGKCTHPFTLSKIIDIPDCDENDNVFASCSISSLYVKAKSNDDNYLTELEFLGNISIRYQILSEVNQTFVTDSYMPDFTTKCEDAALKIRCNPVYFYDDKSQECIFQSDNDIIEIIDLKAEIISSQIENSLLVSNIRLTFLYYDKESNVCNFEDEQKISVKLSDEELHGIAEVNIISYDYLIKSSNAVALRINYEYRAYLYSQENIKYITDIVAENKIDNIDKPQLTLYFADANEDVWNIAKSFSTDMSLIMSENNLNSQIIENKTVLLVPGM